MASFPAPTVWLKHPAAVFTANNADAKNGVVIQGTKIIELVPSGQQPKIKVDQYIDCSPYIITPGLINTHHHFYQTLTRCVPGALNQPLFPWLKFLYQVWKNLTPEMLYSATQLAGLELMLSGATTVADHHYVFPKGLENGIDIRDFSFPRPVRKPRFVANNSRWRLLVTKGNADVGHLDRRDSGAGGGAHA
ncbi:MAG: amidohydrolase family protein, partial [Paraglaciecola sp.]|nr:amidohydrolase family protein [Paraglaciecola sp.]